MITGKNIICFASGWDFYPTSKHHIMRQLAAHNHVIWVNWHASRRPSLTLADLKTAAGKLVQIRRGPTCVTPNLTVITPPQLPLPHSRWARTLTTRLVCRAVRNVLASLPRRPVQVWSFAPDVGDLIGEFDEELVVYYCVDAFGEFPGYDREWIERRENELISRCNVVLTTSQPLYEAKQQLHPHVFMVEHGVDYHHLSRAVNETLQVPDDLARLQRPVMGFVGVVGEWVNMPLLASLAAQRGDASIVLIGPAQTPMNTLTALPNVHWLGPRDHSLLPNYLRGFDVGLIPFRDVPLTRHANPIKLYEYLAAGVPVVSTPLPAVTNIERSVWQAREPNEFTACCNEAVRYADTDHRLHRARLMAGHSWSGRIERISAMIDTVMTGGSGEGPSDGGDGPYQPPGNTPDGAAEVEPLPVRAGH